MNHFWASFFVHLKDCGRNATLFMIALAGVFGLMLLTAALYENHLENYLIGVVSVAAIFMFVSTIAAFVRARTRRRERLSHSPLSLDEMRKARAKLTKNNGPYRQSPA
jgi:uncharacterized membrane protein YbhN (UPF0104 family)